METPSYIKGLLKPNGRQPKGRKVWSIDLQYVWLPFFTSCSVSDGAASCPGCASKRTVDSAGPVTATTTVDTGCRNKRHAAKATPASASTPTTARPAMRPTRDGGAAITGTVVVGRATVLTVSLRTGLAWAAGRTPSARDCVAALLAAEASSSFGAGDDGRGPWCVDHPEAVMSR